MSNCFAYEDLLADVLEKGIAKGDRTGTGTISVFGRQIRYNLEEGFPLITSKRVPFKSVMAELLWFLSGSTNVKPLQEMGCTIWDEWADENGNLGNVYGYQWRVWKRNWMSLDHGVATEHFDQMRKLVHLLQTNPDSRRMLVSAWNVADLPGMALEPCHFAFQCYVVDGRLSLQVYQRSADMFLGAPFNLASYAALIHMLAQQCDLGVGELIWSGGDCHIYNNHLEQVKEQLSREGRGLPQLKLLGRPKDLFSYKLEDFQLEGYNPHPAIKGEVAV